MSDDSSSDESFHTPPESPRMFKMDGDSQVKSKCLNQIEIEIEPEEDEDIESLESESIHSSNHSNSDESISSTITSQPESNERNSIITATVPGAYLSFARQKECPVCLFAIKKRVYLPLCTHSFCKPCILHWSKYSTFCPVCRVPYFKIVTNYNKEIIIKRLDQDDREARDRVRRKRHQFSCIGLLTASIGSFIIGMVCLVLTRDACEVLLTELNRI